MSMGKEQEAETGAKGANPFANVRLQNGRTLDQYVAAHDPPYVNSRDVYAYIRNNLEAWGENALINRRQ